MTSGSSNGAFTTVTTSITTSELVPLMMDVNKTEYKATANEPPSRLASLLSDSEDDDYHKTNQMETFLHLVKGYMGAGCLSLPWAMSQLGIIGGIVAIFAMSFWTSYNCYLVVKLKRFIERTQQQPQQDDDDANSEVSSSNATTNTNVTYPDVGEWAYGRQFQSYVTACICVQQLAICTVFISFVGENLLAVLRRMNVDSINHVGVMTLALPAVLALSFIPSLKSLAPVMAAGSLFLLLTFATLGVVVGMEWNDRPDELPTLNPPGVPLALCAILYSYEGICLILPVESAMKEPQHFQKIFTASMVCVAFMLAAFATICVITFGNVTSGSVTAFLVQAYRGDVNITFWLMAANTAVSLSVLLTYPLQLFPALELMGPWLSEKLSGIFKQGNDENEQDDLSAFEPLPPLPEHDVASLDSLPSEHHYAAIDEDPATITMGENAADDDAASYSAMSSVTSFLPKMTIPGDSLQLRVTLVVLTYLVAVVVPNVQALISLAGALAGSSTALLIPPILELAWIRHLERDFTKETIDSVDSSMWMLDVGKWRRFWMEKVKCYVLLFMGLVFMGIGTFASLSDIVRIYLGDD